MAKEKNKKDNIKEPKKKNKKKNKVKVVVVGMVGIMLFSTLGSLATVLLQNDTQTVEEEYQEYIESYMKYYEDTEKALKQATEIKHEGIEEIVEKQKNKDYSLETVLNILGENPAYIYKDEKVIYDKEEIATAMEKFKNKEYTEDDFIELVWKTNKNHTISTYLATDMKDIVNTIGIVTNDLSVTSSIDSESIPTTDVEFKDIANLDLTLEQIEEKTGKFYTYSVQYPLLTESKVVKQNTRSEDAITTVTQRIIKGENSLIYLNTQGDRVFGLREELEDYEEVVKVDEDIFKEIKDGLTEEKFLSLIPTATLNSIQIAYADKDGSELIQTNYLIKNNEGKAQLIGFDAGKYVLTQPME